MKHILIVGALVLLAAGCGSDCAIKKAKPTPPAVVTPLPPVTTTPDQDQGQHA